MPKMTKEYLQHWHSTYKQLERFTFCPFCRVVSGIGADACVAAVNLSIKPSVRPIKIKKRGS